MKETKKITVSFGLYFVSKGKTFKIKYVSSNYARKVYGRSISGTAYLLAKDLQKGLKKADKKAKHRTFYNPEAYSLGTAKEKLRRQVKTFITWLKKKKFL